VVGRTASPRFHTRPLVSLGSSFSCQSACFRIHLVGRTVDQATEFRHLFLLGLLFLASLHAILIHLGWQDRQLRLHAAWLAGPPAHAFPLDLWVFLDLPFLVRVHASEFIWLAGPSATFQLHLGYISNHSCRLVFAYSFQFSWPGQSHLVRSLWINYGGCCTGDRKRARVLAPSCWPAATTPSGTLQYWATLVSVRKRPHVANTLFVADALQRNLLVACWEVAKDRFTAGARPTAEADSTEYDVKSLKRAYVDVHVWSWHVCLGSGE
jgi:hypothetical protein